MKEYPVSEEQTQIVNEPTVAYGLDLDRLEESVDYRNAPCQFTVEELTEELRKSREDSKAGRVYSTEEVLAHKKLWL